MSLQVGKIANGEEQKAAFKIREEVFVVEQEVDPAAEYDEFEGISTHFLAKLDGIPVGTARWRITQNGVKLERFAVLNQERGKGVGQALVEAVLSDIAANDATADKLKYLHAQLSAVPLYLKFGFEKEGDIFEECNILHYKMKLA
jgi:predicted GNAT family N-acyltransferase